MLSQATTDSEITSDGETTTSSLAAQNGASEVSPTSGYDVSSLITTGCGYDAWTGSTHRHVVDFEVPGAINSHGLKWERTYNSATNTWSFGYNWKLEWKPSFNRVNAFFPDGRQSHFEVGIKERYFQGQDADGTKWSEVYLEDGSIVHFSRDSVWVGEPDHVPPDNVLVDFYQPLWMKDRYGRQISIASEHYGNADQPLYRITGITDEASGRWIKITYGASGVGGYQGLPTLVQGSDGQWVSYHWSDPDDGSPGVLTHVDYSDGTSADYDYSSVLWGLHAGHEGTELIWARDTHATSPMQNIWYEYNSDRNNGSRFRGQIRAEHYLNANNTAGVKVSNFATNYDPQQPEATATETRGDLGHTATRTIHLKKLNQDEGPPFVMYKTDYLVPLHNQMTFGYSPGFFLNSVKDFRQNITTYDVESLIGNIQTLTHPATPQDDTVQRAIQYGYTETPRVGDAHNPYYVSSATDERSATNTTTYKRQDPVNPNDHLITEIDYPDGGIETFAYNAAGQVIKHQRKNGYYEYSDYDTTGLLITLWNPTLKASRDQLTSNDANTTFSYYSSTDHPEWKDRLKSVTDPLGRRTTYKYDTPLLQCAAVLGPNGALLPCHGRGLITEIDYLDDISTGSATGTYKSFGYDAYGNKKWEEDELHHRTTYDYDDYMRLITVTTPPPINGTTRYDYAPVQGNVSLSYIHTTNSAYFITDPDGIVTANTFDENFRKKSSTIGSAQTTYDYDENGNLTSVKDPRGNAPGNTGNYTTSTAYDERNRKQSMTDPLNHTTSWTYGDGVNATAIHRPDGTVENKSYDQMNRVLTDVLPKAGTPSSPSEYVTTTFGYNPSGTLLSVKDGKNQITTFEYDGFDQRTKMIYPNNSDYQTWSYDSARNLIARRTVNDVSQLFGYDARNRQIWMTWSNAADWSSFDYDLGGRIITAQNPISKIVRGYDNANRLTLDRQQFQILPITAVSRKTHGNAGTFDVNLPLAGIPGIEGRLGQGPNSDQHQIVVKFPRAVSYNHVAVSAGTGNVSSSSMSTDGITLTINLSGVIDQQTIVVTLFGVTDGTVTNDVRIGMQVVFGDANGDGLVNFGDTAATRYYSGSDITTSTFMMDVNVDGLINVGDTTLVRNSSGHWANPFPIGQPTSASPNFDVQYTYDAAGKPTRLYAVAGSPAMTNGYDYTFTYDPIMGRFDKIVVTGGSELFQYVYDLASNVTDRTNKANGVNQHNTVDSLNRISERDLVRNGTTIAFDTYTYDPTRPGLLASVTREDGKQDQFGYDLLPELTSAQYGLHQTVGLNATDLNGGDVDIIAYGDHANGNDPAGQITFGNADGAGGGDPLIDQPLDPAAAQTSWSQPNRLVSYGWDKAGNRISLTDTAGQSYTYSTTVLNQYFSDGTAGGNIGCGSEHEMNSYRNVSYNYINDTHLTSVIGNGNNYQMYYDALGRCAVRILNGVTNYYVYDGDKAILEYGAAYGWGASNVYGKGVDEILLRSERLVRAGGAGTYTVYYQADRNGNITHLTDGSGNIVEWYRYDAFGAPVFFNADPNQPPIGGTNWNNRFLFTGREYMPTFSIYEYRNRAYHPGLGRFISEDPKGYDAGDYNLFRYCNNDPEDFTDPSGMTIWPVWFSPIEGELASANAFAAMRAAVRNFIASAAERQAVTVNGPSSRRSGVEKIQPVEHYAENDPRLTHGSNPWRMATDAAYNAHATASQSNPAAPDNTGELHQYVVNLRANDFVKTPLKPGGQKDSVNNTLIIHTDGTPPVTVGRSSKYWGVGMNEVRYSADMIKSDLSIMAKFHVNGVIMTPAAPIGFRQPPYSYDAETGTTYGPR